MNQLRLAQEESLAADLKLTGLTPKLERIREATQALLDRYPAATAASPAIVAGDPKAALAAAADGKDPSGGKIS